MKISIVTISYNQAQYLRDCIESVLDQNYPDIEYVLVDPGSTDGSREIINEYWGKIDRIIFEKDAGAADGLNKGLAYATGDVLGFLNSDDVLLPNALSSVAAFFNAHPVIDVVSGCGYFIDSEGVRLKPIVSSLVTPWMLVHGGVTLFQQGTFFRSCCFKQVGGFNTHNKTCWDGELFLDMALAGARFATIDNDLAYFRLHDAGISGSGRLEKQYRQDSARLFVKATGRERIPYLDSILDKIAKLIKVFINPLYYWRRLYKISRCKAI